MNRKLKIIAALLLALVIAAALYLNTGYRAEPEALALVSRPQVETRQGWLVFTPEEPPTAGFLFYPGGKVQEESYAPLLASLADSGVLCVLTPMPFDLAVLNMNAADGVQEAFPEVEHWYLGGHSLGGAMAASYCAKHQEAFDGLVLLAAYSTADLHASGLRVLQIYGSEDGVINRDSLEKYAGNLPLDARIAVLDGGCHAFFGAYGAQKGDGMPTITREEQLQLTRDAILELMNCA